MRGWLHLAVCATVVAVVVGPCIQEEQSSYVELFAAPQIISKLNDFMGQPGMLLELSRPVFEFEVIATETQELREWVFAQVVAVSSRGADSAIAMVYAGMDDGRFVGCAFQFLINVALLVLMAAVVCRADYRDEGRAPSRYTFRAAGGSAAAANELVLGHFADADAIPDELSLRSPTCDLDPTTDGSSICPVGCDRVPTCSGTSSTLFTISNACPGSSADACTPIASDGTAGCCDKDIRLYFTTSIAARGVPQQLTGWTTYDPRERSWYTEERSRSDEAGGWSSIYVFSTSGELGITRTAKLRADGVDHGVLGIDFDLREVSQILVGVATQTGRAGIWAYVVEAETGLLVGTTFDAPLRDSITFERYTADNIGTASPFGVSESAAILARQGWRLTAVQSQILTNTVPSEITPGPKYEATVADFVVNGLKWLIVIGQTINCAPNEIFGVGACEECGRGQRPCDTRHCLICDEEFLGTVSDGTRCVCPEGTFAVREDDVARCEPCESLPENVLGVREPSSDPIRWERATVCPGGVTSQTIICPLDQLWMEIEDPGSHNNAGMQTTVKLLACPACVSAPCADSSTLARLADDAGITWRTASSDLTSEEWLTVQPKAMCREHHTGYLCAECETRYKMVGDECVLCVETDWHWILTEVALAVVIGFYLLSRTWHSVCKPAEADKVFKTVDVDQNGFLSGNDIKLLLVGMGNPVAASKHYFGNVLAEMKGMPQESFRTKLPKWCGGKEAENSWIAHASISPQEFEDWCTDNQYRATVGIYVFTVQTFAFVMRQESDFSTLELFNMDVQAAVKTCRLPSCELLCGIMGVVAIPLVSGFSMYLGIWFLATKYGTVDDINVHDEATEPSGPGHRKVIRGLPLLWHHLQRGLIQLFLFSFAPVTRKCAEMLVCREVPRDGKLESRLAVNLQLTCWEGQHLLGAIICIMFLLVFLVLLPCVFITKTRTYRQRLAHRSTDKVSQQEKQTVPHIEDVPWGSVCRPSTFLSSKRVDAIIHALLKTPSCEGGADYHKVLELMKSNSTLNPVCWDELCKATRPEKYWWFVFILLLKMVVNVIFLLGRVHEYNWAMWTQIVLVFAALLSHYNLPYEKTSDNRLEQLSFLGLSLILTVTSSGVMYAKGWKWYHLVVVMLVVALMCYSTAWILFMAYFQRKRRERRVESGHHNLKGFTRTVFRKAIPGFLLLPDEHREQIRKHIQVETFTEGETIYEQGDNANAFYIVKKGKVKLSSTEEGRPTMNIKAGDYFGASALDFGNYFGTGAEDRRPRVRVATAVVTSDEMICLRLLRVDWFETWKQVTYDVAAEVFQHIHHDHQGRVAREDLESMLRKRWTTGSESESERESEKHVTEAVDGLMRTFDRDGDGRISKDEFMSNLHSIPDDCAPATAFETGGVTSAVSQRRTSTPTTRQVQGRLHGNYEGEEVLQLGGEAHQESRSATTARHKRRPPPLSRLPVAAVTAFRGLTRSGDGSTGSHSQIVKSKEAQPMLQKCQPPRLSPPSARQPREDPSQLHRDSSNSSQVATSTDVRSILQNRQAPSLSSLSPPSAQRLREDLSQGHSKEGAALQLGAVDRRRSAGGQRRTSQGAFVLGGADGRGAGQGRAL